MNPEQAQSAQQMSPELQKQVDDHFKRVVDQIHEIYKPITSGLTRQLAEAQLDVVSMSHQNAMLQKQSEALHTQLQESLQTISNLTNNSSNGEVHQDPSSQD